MIRRVSSDAESFRVVDFNKGFNVILAERAAESTDKDTRNGVGKTTLLEIIHFCFGGSLANTKVLNRDEIKGWTFKLDFDIDDEEYSVSRSTSTHSKVIASGDFTNWDLPDGCEISKNQVELKVTDWTKLLGVKMFNIEDDPSIKYNPTYRSLISYFFRRPDAFRDPFQHHRKQLEWDKQVNVAFLLGLDWKHAARFQVIKDDEQNLRKLREAVEAGQLAGHFGSMGELDAERVKIAQSVRKLEDQLKDFKVHPQYEEIERIANRLTSEIKELVNSRVLNERMVDVYKQSLKAEEDVSVIELERVYNEAGVSFPELVIKELKEVELFHEKVLENRKQYLANEITRLENEIVDLGQKIKDITEERANHFKILSEHGALDEYNLLLGRLSSLRQQLEEVKNRIQTLTDIENKQSKLKIARQELYQDTKTDITERAEIIDLSREFFMENSRALYNIPGRFTVDAYEGGYRFKVDIERAGSEGIERMKTFCFDLMLIQLRSKMNLNPKCLMHDSGIFDGVDQRQVAKAIELAYGESKTRKFQYICSINSDAIPVSEFSEGFEEQFRDAIIIKLVDRPQEESLLGIRF